MTWQSSIYRFQWRYEAEFNTISSSFACLFKGDARKWKIASHKCKRCNKEHTLGKYSWSPKFDAERDNCNMLYWQNQNTTQLNKPNQHVQQWFFFGSNTGVHLLVVNRAPSSGLHLPGVNCCNRTHPSRICLLMRYATVL